jgi:hypothetical protein
MKATAYNVAALDKVLGLATQVGDSYKPGNASIECTALRSLLEESRKSVTAVLKAEGDLTSAINRRQEAFATLPMLGMQIRELADSGGMDEKDLQDLDRMRKRFRSQPFKPALNSASGGQNKTSVDVSDSSTETTLRKNRQLSFDNQAVTLESIIRFLEDKPLYNPTEPQFTIEGLKAKLAELQACNTAINDAKSELTNIRAMARKMIFDRKSGVYGKARMTKRYLKAILGRDADLYKSISKVKFKNK